VTLSEFQEVRPQGAGDLSYSINAL